MSKSTTLFYILLDTVMFVFSVMALIGLVTSGTDVTYKVQSVSLNNETISKTRVEAEFDGYSRNGKTVYDGVLSGKQVYTDILNGADRVIIIGNGNTTTNLDVVIVTYTAGSTTKTARLIDYVRNNNPSKLTEYVDMNASYIRQYTTDTTGNIVSTVYAKQ